MVRNLTEKECKLILGRNYVGNLAFIENNKPFVLPITFTYNLNNNVIISYSGEGHKVKAMRKLSNVSVGVTEIDSITDWKSVMAHGRFKELRGHEAQSFLHDFSLGVKKSMLEKEFYKPSFIEEFSAKIAASKMPVIYIIELDTVTGKMRKEESN